MQSRLFTILLGLALILFDQYLLTGLVAAFKKRRLVSNKWFKLGYTLFSVILVTGTIASIYLNIPVGVRAGFLLLFFVLIIVKVTFLPFVLIDDIRRLIIKLRAKSKKPVPKAPEKDAIPRSEFLMKAGLIAGAVPLASIGFGIYEGAYDYHVRKQTLYLPNLPKAFDGLTIGQISDIHSGSFYNKKAVVGGVEMLLGQKPDVIFFTGDLVNKRTDEVYGYQDIFSKVKAPLGVFSTLGNHDYGDYYHNWKSLSDKKKNLEDIIITHKNMGWDLLLNENRRLKVDGQEIGILGCENWGELTRFPKYGKMEPTIKGTQELPVRLLLSHDPSHWRAQILPHYPQIDVMFAGHTHGMQFGVRAEHFQWSPVEYVYKEWAGLYHEGSQQLYVNVGYGFLGFPGRVGILPEITIFTLRSAHDPLSTKI
ncbi:metallophosphoesterase [Mucilaginibacter sp. UR6-11]|uniref:metallophosphoesterase n=1 Tax=Mucilaginibacter sp. UR6-11 TaxID=1435644 RepID=UPI001E4073C7|nr:metallophosphoesterase [Mucilaginibacter sp. UR6-11]MCC8425156.1 metallophosphoesterase [Mucilaginibacter sp. UR6-11]